ncbi:DUF4034 domain-containing protein [Andreprevotia lacus]|jgi:hypothetical protein|nr:DUF4034 domain-containing protein [Andreprevotia lacus]
MALANAALREASFDSEAERYEALLIKKQYQLVDNALQRALDQQERLSGGLPVLNAGMAGLTKDLHSGCDCIKNAEVLRKKLPYLLEWRKRMPKSPFAEIAVPRLRSNLAWSYRGYGYANTVSNQAWQAFRDEMTVAQKMLLEASPAARSNPEWYVTMLKVQLGLGVSEKEFRAVYDEGQQRYPDYYPIYKNAAIYFTERWFGSNAKYKQFVDDAVARTRAKLGETLFAKLHDLEYSDDMFRSGEVDWPRMKAGLERIQADYPDRYNLNVYARYACQAADWPTLRKLMVKVGNNPDKKEWDRTGPNFYDFCVSAVART